VAKYILFFLFKGLLLAVLTPENPNRRYLIDQVVSTALPQAKDAEEVSSTVKV
jgi:clathrin heavy chain